MSFGFGSSGSCQVACSAGTDNKGNSFVVSRLLTTKFPLCAFLMELALQLHVKKVNLELYWLPRLQNIEADSLTNDDASKFDTKYRVRFDLQKFEGLVLGDMLRAGVELYEEIKQCRAVKLMAGIKKGHAAGKRPLAVKEKGTSARSVMPPCVASPFRWGS